MPRVRFPALFWDYQFQLLCEREAMAPYIDYIDHLL